MMAYYSENYGDGVPWAERGCGSFEMLREEHLIPEPKSIDECYKPTSSILVYIKVMIVNWDLSRPFNPKGGGRRVI